MKRHPFTPSACKGGFTPYASRLLIAGHILILVALCDFAARLHAGNPDAILYIEDFASSVSLGGIILWGFGILLDSLERGR